MATAAAAEQPAGRFAKDHLKAFVERVERLEEEKKAIGDDIRDVYAEAKASGFDVKELVRAICNSQTYQRTSKPVQGNEDAEPHQYATGVRDVFVNGTPVIRDGEHIGALPGRVVRGPGWTGWKE